MTRGKSPKLELNFGALLAPASECQRGDSIQVAAPRQPNPAAHPELRSCVINITKFPMLVLLLSTHRMLGYPTDHILIPLQPPHSNPGARRTMKMQEHGQFTALSNGKTKF